MKLPRSRLPSKNSRLSSSSLNASVMLPLMPTAFLLMLLRNFVILLPLCLILTTTKDFEQPLSYSLHLKLPLKKSSTNHAMFLMMLWSDNLATTLRLFRRLYVVKERIKEITGVYPLMHDMCPNTCMAYTGPFSELDSCTKCSTPRYNPEVLATSGGIRKFLNIGFVTLPIGPQLQAIWRTPEGARNMRYRQISQDQCLKKLPRILTKKLFSMNTRIYSMAVRILRQFTQAQYKTTTWVLMLSIDGAQLYQSKQSDCWIYIWIILDLAPAYNTRSVIYSLAAFSLVQISQATLSHSYTLASIMFWLS